MSGHRLFQDDLPTTPSISRLRASGVVTAETRSVIVTFGEGGSALKRKVRVTHQKFRNGGSWSFFVCPDCGRPRAFLSCTVGRCVGAAVFAKGLGIAYRAARQSSATWRGWRGYRSCASCSTAGRRDCIRGQAADWTADGRLRFRGGGE